MRRNKKCVQPLKIRGFGLYVKKYKKIINAHSGSSIVTAKEKNLFISFFAQKLIRLCAFLLYYIRYSRQHSYIFNLHNGIDRLFSKI